MPRKIDTARFFRLQYTNRYSAFRSVYSTCQGLVLQLRAKVQKIRSNYVNLQLINILEVSRHFPIFFEKTGWLSTIFKTAFQMSRSDYFREKRGPKKLFSRGLRPKIVHFLNVSSNFTLGNYLFIVL